MNHLGIEVSVKNVPELDPGFIPLAQFNRAFLAGADKPLDVAVERSNGQVAVWHVKIHSNPAMAAADEYYVERVIKTMLWMYGGFRVYIAGSDELVEKMKVHYSAQGRQAFDWDYMANVFEHPFEIIACDKVPEENSDPKAIGRHLDGCRIGFDAGGSDRKVSAVIDGEPVFSEEVVWFPKINSDPDYHYDGIVAALKSAAEHMPRVDAVGVSSAGVYIDNRTMNASLFLKVPKEIYDETAAFINRDTYVSAGITLTYARVFRKSLVTLPFILLIGVMNPVFDHRVAMTVCGVDVWAGWISFISIVVRGLLSVQAALLLVYVCGFNGVCRALGRLGLPSVMVTQLLMVSRYMQTLGEEAVVPAGPWMASESMAVYNTLYRGVLAFLGIQDQQGCGAPHHSGEFDLDPDLLYLGTGAIVSYALDFLDPGFTPPPRKPSAGVLERLKKQLM